MIAELYFNLYQSVQFLGLPNSINCVLVALTFSLLYRNQLSREVRVPSIPDITLRYEFVIFATNQNLGIVRILDDCRTLAK